MFFYSEQIPTIVVPLHLTSSFNSLSFPSTCIGTSSLLSVYVTAAQLAGATVEIVSVGDDSDQFDQTPLSFALTGGVTNQIIDITFTPTSWGLKTATVILSASNGSVINVSLEGMAAAVPLILTSSVDSLSFGSTTVNTTSSMNVVVSAGGFTSVVETVTLSDNSNQFSFSPASFELTGSGTSRTVAVTYSPTITGSVTGTLTLSSSGGNTKLISLGGSGAAAVDAYAANVSLLLTGEGATIVDSSANNTGMTILGTTISTAAFKSGTRSLFFDGNSDRIGANSSANFDFGTGNFTIEMWINPSATGNNVQKQLFGKRLSTAVFGWMLSFMTYSTATSNYGLAFYVTVNGSAWGIQYAPVTRIPINVWSHLAYVRSGNEYSVYINGIKNVAGTLVGTPVNNTSQFTLGAFAAGTDPLTNGYGGYMDNVRVTKGIARYTSNFTPPVDI